MLREGEPHKSQSSLGHGASPARLVRCARPPVPRQASLGTNGRRGEPHKRLPPRPHHYGGRTHPYMRTSPCSEDTSHHTTRAIPATATWAPSRKARGARSSGRRQGKVEGAEQEKATDTHVYAGARIHVHVPKPARTLRTSRSTLPLPHSSCIQSNSEHHAPPAGEHGQLQKYIGNSDENPGDRSHGPQPGTDVISSALPAQKIPDPKGPKIFLRRAGTMREQPVTLKHTNPATLKSVRVVPARTRPSPRKWTN